MGIMDGLASSGSSLQQSNLIEVEERQSWISTQSHTHSLTHSIRSAFSSIFLMAFAGVGKRIPDSIDL